MTILLQTSNVECSVYCCPGCQIASFMEVKNVQNNGELCPVSDTVRGEETLVTTHMCRVELESEARRRRATCTLPHCWALNIKQARRCVSWDLSWHSFTQNIFACTACTLLKCESIRSQMSLNFWSHLAQLWSKPHFAWFPAQAAYDGL